MRNKLRYLTLPALLAVCSIWLVSGCGEQATPLGSNEPDNGAAGLNWIDESGIDPFAKADGKGGTTGPNAAKVEFDAGVALVTPRLGGAIGLHLGTNATSFFVPPGAVPRPILVSMLAAQINTPHGSVALYEFGPNGFVFRAPTTLKLQVDVPDGEIRSLFWWNPATHDWEKQDESVVKKGVVTFTVWHFSKYGIA